MSRTYAEIDAPLRDFLVKQHVFFVATAPLAASGHVNLSPKGLDSFRVLDARRVAYLDLTGSGVETIAHLRENGRIVLMFCAFSGPAKIVRLHGRGRPILPGDPEFASLARQFSAHAGIRSVIAIDLERISDSCGYGVPRYEFSDERRTLTEWALRKTPQELASYRAQNNARSIDELEGLPASEGS